MWADILCYVLVETRGFCYGFAFAVLEKFCYTKPAFSRPPFFGGWTSFLRGFEPSISIRYKKNRQTAVFFISGRNERILLWLRLRCPWKILLHKTGVLPPAFFRRLNLLSPEVRVPSYPMSYKKKRQTAVFFITGRNERIWTSGPYVPNVVLYQAELRFDCDKRVLLFLIYPVKPFLIVCWQYLDFMI